MARKRPEKALSKDVTLNRAFSILSDNQSKLRQVKQSKIGGWIARGSFVGSGFLIYISGVRPGRVFEREMLEPE